MPPEVAEDALGELLACFGATLAVLPRVEADRHEARVRQLLKEREGVLLGPGQ